jgi:hypothetical protein
MSERERLIVHPHEFVRVVHGMSNKKRWAIFRTTMNRRSFMQTVAGGTGLLALDPVTAMSRPAAKATAKTAEDEKIQRLVDAHRPSRLKKLPRDFNARVGATHAAGKYHLTDKPFLIEGAEQLLKLGTRLGKFFLMPGSETALYPFNSQWKSNATLVDLARSEYYQALFALPFSTIILETALPGEGPGIDFQATPRRENEITQAYYDLAAHLYQVFHSRRATVIIQHWEGDWMIRGSGQLWNPPPANWKQRCENMARWLAARQAGVVKARREFGKGAKCRIAHAAEVNRVTDLWKGIPTMTEHVLPKVELDLVSYSCYDGVKDGVTLWKCIAEIKRHARTTGLFKKNPVYIGEVGIPENDQPHRVTERWDELLGAMLAAEVPYIAMWELYCNEIYTDRKPPVTVPVKNLKDVRGFWLVRPDGSLSEAGRLFTSLWQRGRVR